MLATNTFPCHVIAKILVPIINQSHVEKGPAVRLFGILCQQVSKNDLVDVVPSIVPSLIEVNLLMGKLLTA